jgi:acyl-CoA reductase-like NAD-dependent aldehyde dehydrogenase
MAKAQQARTKRTSTKTYLNFIGGEWVKSSSGEWFENVNPADSNDVVGRFPLSTADDVNRAVSAAKSAATRWKKTPAPRRAEILFSLGDILRKNKDRYAAEMTREMGKVLKETGGDVQEAIDCTGYAAGDGRRLHA